MACSDCLLKSWSQLLYGCRLLALSLASSASRGRQGTEVPMSYFTTLCPLRKESLQPVICYETIFSATNYKVCSGMWDGWEVMDCAGGESPYVGMARWSQCCACEYMLVISGRGCGRTHVPLWFWRLIREESLSLQVQGLSEKENLTPNIWPF